MNKRLEAKILSRAAELLESGWCQGNLSQDKNGIPCQLDTKKAAKFCVSGALTRAAYENGVKPTNYKPILDLQSKFSEALGRDVVNFNDHADTTQTDVVDAVLNFRYGYYGR